MLDALSPKSFFLFVFSISCPVIERLIFLCEHRVLLITMESHFNCFPEGDRNAFIKATIFVHFLNLLHGMYSLRFKLREM
jgi:hypothetical protein